MAGTSAGARKGWLTRRGQRLPRDPQQRARIAAIEEHAAGTFAGPLRSGPAARTQPSRTERHGITTLRELVPIVPAGTIPYDRDEKPSAYRLQQLYGNRQLRDALDGYTVATLKEMAREVQSRNPGTQPANWFNKSALISYIEGRLTRPAPAAPAKSSPPVRGQRVRSGMTYEQWLSQIETIKRTHYPKRFGYPANQGMLDAVEKHWRGHPAYAARYRRETGHSYPLG